MFVVAMIVFLVTGLLAVAFRGAEWKSETERLKASLNAAQREAAELRTMAEVREKQIAEQEADIANRERSIDGRESAATDRTLSSFQGLMIQQQLVRNLEALKASIPDMTPEIEKLAKEHAQLTAESERLSKENADLRRQFGSRPLPPER